MKIRPLVMAVSQLCFTQRCHEEILNILAITFVPPPVLSVDETADELMKKNDRINFHFAYGAIYGGPIPAFQKGRMSFTIW